MALRLSGLRILLQGPEHPARQRSRAGTPAPCSAFVLDGGFAFIRPTGGSRKPYTRRPGKRSAAGQDT
ncbi:hypothetical protein HPS03_25575 [Klebsiella pneumoniae]|nr:hypothetical protein HPS03_25575 [Klebsiella pneumoniae]